MMLVVEVIAFNIVAGVGLVHRAAAAGSTSIFDIGLGSAEAEKGGLVSFAITSFRGMSCKSGVIPYLALSPYSVVVIMPPEFEGLTPFSSHLSILRAPPQTTSQ